MVYWGMVKLFLDLTPEKKSKYCQHCNRSTLINYNCLKLQIAWQLSEIPYLVKELCKEPFFDSFPNDKF